MTDFVIGTRKIKSRQSKSKFNKKWKNQQRDRIYSEENQRAISCKRIEYGEDKSLDIVQTEFLLDRAEVVGVFFGGIEVKSNLVLKNC